MLFSHITQLVVWSVFSQVGSFTATDYMVLEWNGRNPPLAPFESIERRCSAHLLEGGVPTGEGSRLEWLLRRGQARFYQGDNEGAQTDLEECCKLSPDDDRVQFELARCLVETEVSRERGKEMAERLASKQDAAARGHFVVGNYHIMTSDARSAEAAYTKVIDLDPNWTEARLRRASCYYALGKDLECVGDLTFLGSLPQCAGFTESVARLLLGCSLARLDRTEQAYAVLVDAKFTKPDDPAIHNTLWMLCAWQGKYGHCMDLSAKWVERFPFDAVANQRAALSCASVGDLDSATKYAKKLLAIAPDAPGASAVAARICATRRIPRGEIVFLLSWAEAKRRSRFEERRCPSTRLPAGVLSR